AAYSAGFAPESFLGLDSFQLSGGDLLDRQKLRVNLTLTTPPFPPISQQLNEEQLASLLNVPFSVTLPISGPIRALGGNEAQQIAFYGWQYETSLSLDLSDVVTGFTTIHIEQIRSSRDWLDPASSGLGSVTYFDSNTPAGVPVDGAPDSVASLPIPLWQELNTTQGHILTLAAIDPGLGTAAGYYLDNSQPNGNDTGDGRSFGDHGFVITEPNGVITVSETVWIWPTGGGSAGSQAQNYNQQPLAVTTTGQSYAPLTRVFLPIINRP
ncbi:MAG: hypothetical protein KDE04_25590, partial [Anaerolineales bacterium]|nr:hypothetical protein [Anaerolineales bacterium]